MLLLPNLLKGGAKTVSVQQAVQLANQSQGIFLDIRSHESFKAGSIPQARNLPEADLQAKLGTLPKHKPIIIVCDQGRNSARIASSEERRVGKECVSKCRSRWPTSHYKNTNKSRNQVTDTH